METSTILWIVVIALVLLLVVGLIVAAARRKATERRRTQAEEIRHEAAAGTGDVSDADIRAREAEAEAERARLQAQRAEKDAAGARRDLDVEHAQHEDRVREADRLDPDVDHRATDYQADADPLRPDEPGRRI